MQTLLLRFKLLPFLWFVFSSDLAEATCNSSSDPSINELQSAIVMWLSANFGLPEIYDHPRVRLVTAEKLSQMRYKSSDLANGREVEAVYDDATATILLRETWTGKTPADLSILVHEMVHHLQNKGNLTFHCPAAREKLAYTAQAQWLSLFGADLFKEFDLDPTTLKLTTDCVGH